MMCVVDRRVVRGIERRGGGTMMWLRLLIRSGNCSGFGRKRNPNGMKKLIILPNEWRRRRFTERKRQRGKSLWKSLSSRKDVATCFAQLNRWSVKTRIVGDGCIKDSDGNVVVEQAKIKEVWRKHYEKLLNEEFDWNQESLESVDAVSGPAEEITEAEVRAAIANIKTGNAVG